MVSVGVCGDGRQTAAVVAVDGAVVSAVQVVEPLGSSHGSSAIAEALRAARLGESEVDVIVRAGGANLDTERPFSSKGPASRMIAVSRAVAEANQLRANLDTARLVVVLDDHGTAAGEAVAVTMQAAQSETGRIVPDTLMHALARVAEAIGADPQEPVASLSRVA